MQSGSGIEHVESVNSAERQVRTARRSNLRSGESASGESANHPREDAKSGIVVCGWNELP